MHDPTGEVVVVVKVVCSDDLHSGQHELDHHLVTPSVLSMSTGLAN